MRRSKRAERPGRPARVPAAAPPAAEIEPAPGPWLAAGVYLLAGLVFFLPAFLPGRQLLGTDFTFVGYFSYGFMSEMMSRGELPLWMPHVFGGIPMHSNPSSTYYPLRILLDLVLPLHRVLPALLVVQLAIGGLGMYLLAAELGARRWVAFLGGLAFALTGQIVSYAHAGHDGRTIVATWTPVLFFLLLRGIRSGRPLPFVGVAATVGVALLSFQLQSVYYMLIGGLLWAAYLLWSHDVVRDGRRLARTVAMGLLAVTAGFALAAVDLLPFAGYAAESPRGIEGGRGLEFSVSYSMPPAELLGVAVPEQAGRLEGYRGDAPLKLHTEYLGAFVVLLVALGIAGRRPRREWAFFAGLAVFALTIAFGGYTPIYRLYLEVLPGTARLRAPGIAFFVVSFASVAMATLALERLARLRSEGAVPPTVRMLLLAVPAVVLLASLSAAIAGAEGTAVQGWVRFLLFVVPVALLLRAWLAQRRSSRTLLLVLAPLLLLDLWLVGSRFLRTTEGPETLYAADGVIRRLLELEDVGRVWTFAIPGPQPIPVYMGNGFFGPQSNYLMGFGIEQVGGEHGNQPQRWNEFLGAGSGTVLVDWHNLLAHGSLMDAANVRYLVTGAEITWPADPERFTLVHQEGAHRIYRNERALPRAYLVPAVERVEAGEAIKRMTTGGWDPRQVAFVEGAVAPDLGAGPLAGDAEVLEHAPNRVRVRTRADRPALLVLADGYDRWWRVEVNGAPAELLPTNHAFRGVVVPAGESEVVFRYQPEPVFLGMRISIGTALLLAAIAIAAHRGRRRAPA